VFDNDGFGICFGKGDLVFWYTEPHALGEATNGFTSIEDRHFFEPEDGPRALNSGQLEGFVFTAFQVLLVRPTEGLCALRR
jgi:hypothetical protein